MYFSALPSKIYSNLSQKLLTTIFGAHISVVVKFGHFEKWFRNTCKFLKYCAGE
jgi:hypothetical protein